MGVKREHLIIDFDTFRYFSILFDKYYKKLN